VKWAYKVGAGARRKIPPNNSAKFFNAYLGGHGFLRYFISSDNPATSRGAARAGAVAGTIAAPR
jgi:hypothetical protein